ncbi:MAG: HDOD domain-containing protein [Candidatus Omnitrophica bacterium]|nr:HDOD domain-containing protein [Candidatus Omnitrophota bacterium]MCA9448067.1 HDOD domain-containing protein [Candidatus Omnitrophota bacterium]
MSNNALVNQILQDIHDIPPLPEIATRVMQLTNDPDVSAAELNKVISQDEALTANLLKLCNSSYYGLPRVISSVTQAIMYLGFQTVRNMVLATAMENLYQREDLSVYGYTPHGLSEHSFATAVASQVVSKKLRPGLGDTAFTAGLLHAVGRIVLAKYAREHETKLREVSEADHITSQAEKEVFGADYAEIGAKIADNWNFPQELILAIGYHLDPEEAKGRPLLAVIVYLGNVVCQRLGVGLIEGPREIPLSDYCTEATGVSEEDMKSLCEEVHENVRLTAEPNPKA